MRHGTLSNPGNRSTTVLILLITLIAVLVSGCLRANVSMTISGDDLVSGQLKFATKSSAGATALKLTPPPELADRVSVTPMKSDEGSGTLLSFNDLSFAEVERLGKALTGDGSRYQFHLERSGSLVSLRGAVDLTPLADTSSKVVIEVSAPGEATATNGKESAGLIRWNPEPGEVTPLSATFQYTGGETEAWVYWALLVGIAALGSAVYIGWLAHRQSDRTTLRRRL